MLTTTKPARVTPEPVCEARNACSSPLHTLGAFFFGSPAPSECTLPDHSDEPPCWQHALVEHACDTRRIAERFIATRFSECYGARIGAFMPRLFTVQRDDGSVGGAFGLRSARHTLFIEQYLDRPVERILAEQLGVRVERSGIVEVGHLSGAFPGAMRTLILLLMEHLVGEGFQWVVFTGTTQVRNAFHRLGLRPLDLGPADVSRLPADDRAGWGRYYDHAPRVLAGRIQDGMTALGSARRKAGGAA